MKILFAMPVIGETGGFEGSIVFNGKEVKFRNSFDALDVGIGMAYVPVELSVPGTRFAVGPKELEVVTEEFPFYKGGTARD